MERASCKDKLMLVSNRVSADGMTAGTSVSGICYIDSSFLASVSRRSSLWFAPQHTNSKPACLYLQTKPVCMKAVCMLLSRPLSQLLWLQAARFAEESNHQRKVQLFFTIILTLLEHQLLTVKQKCTPAALAADHKIDVEAMFRCITNAVKVRHARDLAFNGKVSCQSKQIGPR